MNLNQLKLYIVGLSDPKVKTKKFFVTIVEGKFYVIEQRKPMGNCVKGLVKTKKTLNPINPRESCRFQRNKISSHFFLYPLIGVNKDIWHQILQRNRVFERKRKRIFGEFFLAFCIISPHFCYFPDARTFILSLFDSDTSVRSKFLILGVFS